MAIGESFYLSAE